MAVEEQDWLPKPPPPRPARRDAAIEAAVRKFDGVEELAPVDRPRRGWVSTHRPQFAAMVTAMLLVVVGIPAALVGLRDQSTTSERNATPEVAVHDNACPSGNCGVKHEPSVPPATARQVAQAPPSAPRAVEPPAVRYESAPVAAPTESITQSLPAAPAAEMASAAPPPPPPPPPAAAQQAMTQDIAVTGARVAQPGLASPQGFAAKAADRTANEAKPQTAGYGQFLSRLQAAVRAGDRSAVIKLISFPLRVNSQSRSRVYRDRQSVERDFDLIFTAKVKQAILAQRADQLFVRDQGVMIGNGEVWFDQSCDNAQCSPLGPLRIIAVNR